MPVYQRTYDSKGNLVSTTEVDYQRRPQRQRMGCGTMFGLTLLIGLVILFFGWPLLIEQHHHHVLGTWIAAGLWWGLLGSELIAWAHHSYRVRHPRPEPPEILPPPSHDASKCGYCRPPEPVPVPDPRPDLRTHQAHREL